MKSWIVFSLVFVSVFSRPAETCLKTLEGDGKYGKFKAKYDLSPIAEKDYKVRDVQASTASRNYTYVFQFCGNVRTIPTLENGLKCYQSAPEEDPVSYPAYQVNAPLNICLRLGQNAKTENTEWKLLDSDDPSIGVTYTYLNGDDKYCGSIKRSFSLDLVCSTSEYNIPDEEPVYEPSGCHYTMQIETGYGCPVECGFHKGKLCAQQGVCKLNRDTGAANCFCFSGWHGFACGDEGENTSEGFTSTTFIMIAVLAFIVLVEVGVIGMWGRVKALRLDPNAYADVMTNDEFAP